MLLVKPGERIPADATIVDGSSAIYESAITGESMPVMKRIGDSVVGGTVNSDSPLKIKVVRTGSDTTLAQIIRIVREAASSKVPVQRLADRVSSYFVPLVVFIGITALDAFASVNLCRYVPVSMSVIIIVDVSKNTPPEKKT